MDRDPAGPEAGREDAPQGHPDASKATTCVKEALGGWRPWREVGSAGPLPGRQEVASLGCTGVCGWTRAAEGRPRPSVRQPPRETPRLRALGLWLLVPTAPSLKLYFLSDVLAQ